MNTLAAGAIRSRTIWLSVALAALSAVAASLDADREFLGEYGPAIGMGVAVAMAVLRVLTTLPLEAKAPPREPPHDDGTADDSQ